MARASTQHPGTGEPRFSPESHWTVLIHERWCRQRADEYVSAYGLKVDDEDRLKIRKAIGSGAQQAMLALKRQAKGDFSPDGPPR